MNKTRRRAIQKHRAKAVKFKVRGKPGGDPSGTRSKAVAPAPAAASTRSRPAARKPGAEGVEQ